MLINSLVFNLGDVVQITATAVDLDYANKGGYHWCIACQTGDVPIMMHIPSNHFE